jgi:hypothetical protein
MQHLGRQNRTRPGAKIFGRDVASSDAFQIGIHVLPGWRYCQLLEAIAYLTISNPLPLRIEIATSPTNLLASKAWSLIHHIPKTRLAVKLSAKYLQSQKLI